ncbi:MAG: NGG1p interacting factor NIF3 [Candidatus Brocadiia bacterium]
MKLSKYFKKAIKVGGKYDPRTEAGIKRELEQMNKDYSALGEREKRWFDVERLWNPYVDARVFFQGSDPELKKVAVGIDIDVSDLLLIHELNKQGGGFNAVMSHHPAGNQMAFHHALEAQVDMFASWGVPINQAEALMKPRVAEVSRGLFAVNSRRLAKAAEMIGMPLLSLHSPADVCVQSHVQGTIDKAKPRTLKDAMELLTDEYPEYADARSRGEAMRLFAGSEKNQCGRIVVKMAGGTQGPVEQFGEFARAGIGTVVCMHLRDDARKEAEKNNINILIAGHMASDSIGMNILLGETDPAGEVEIVPMSGYIYVDRRTGK